MMKHYQYGLPYFMFSLICLAAELLTPDQTLLCTLALVRNRAIIKNSLLKNYFFGKANAQENGSRGSIVRQALPDYLYAIE
jgi:hypothetical protein